MQPQMEKRDREATRKDFPDGIPPTAPMPCASPSVARLHRTRHQIRHGRIEGYRNFCNKIWNAANYVR